MASDILEEGISLYERENYSAALAYFLSLPQESDADSAELAYYLGLTYAKLKRYDDALLYLEQVVTSASEEMTASEAKRVLQCRFLLAVIYCLSGRKKLADFELNKLLEIGYNRSQVNAALAYIAWQQGEAERCIDYYAEALALNENNATALNGMGYVLACEGHDLTKALSYCKKALTMAPDSPACLDSLGWVYYKMGIDSEAKKYLYKAQKKAPDNKEIAAHIEEAERGAE